MTPTTGDVPPLPADASPDTPRRWWLPGLTTQILIGLVIGVLIGHFHPAFGVEIRPVADAFLRMIKMIIAPLLFSTLVVGIAGTGDTASMGRIGFKAIVYFTTTTVVVLVIGLVFVNAFQPGAGLAVPLEADPALGAMSRQQRGAWDIFVNLFPTSIVDAMARGEILQIVVFSLVFGVALAAVGPPGRPLVHALDLVAHTMFKFTAIVMLFAPVGVMAAIAATIGDRGLVILWTLGKLVLTLYGALLLVVFLVIGGVALIIRVPFWTFFRAIREPFLIAFTTASSEAALPRALQVMERFGVPRNIVGFVVPLGYSFNLDGTTLYLSIASIFVAQLAGIDLSIWQQIIIMATLLLTSKGVAGVPRAALVVLTATLTTFGLPLEGAAILLGIDQVLDMGRTAVNVMGNCIAAAVVARWEGVLDDSKIREFATVSKRAA
jgi:proton glutamate symport protein